MPPLLTEGTDAKTGNGGRDLKPIEQMNEETMSDITSQIVDAAVDGDAARINELVAAAMRERIADAVDAIRPDVAAAVFEGRSKVMSGKDAEKYAAEKAKEPKDPKACPKSEVGDR